MQFWLRGINTALRFQVRNKELFVFLFEEEEIASDPLQRPEEEGRIFQGVTFTPEQEERIREALDVVARYHYLKGERQGKEAIQNEIKRLLGL